MTEEELKVMIDEIEDEGVLETQESNLVRSALEFDEITVDEIITPRVRITAVEAGENIDDVRKSSFRRNTPECRCMSVPWTISSV